MGFRKLGIATATAVGLTILTSSYAYAGGGGYYAFEQNRISRELKRKVQPCIPSASVKRIGRVIVRVNTNPDGTLLGRPSVVMAASEQDGNAIVEAVMECITPKNPLQFRATKYPMRFRGNKPLIWKEFHYTYSPDFP